MFDTFYFGFTVGVVFSIILSHMAPYIRKWRTKREIEGITIWETRETASDGRPLPEGLRGYNAIHTRKRKDGTEQEYTHTHLIFKEVEDYIVQRTIERERA